jgi:hypothetical protein
MNGTWSRPGAPRSRPRAGAARGALQRPCPPKEAASPPEGLPFVTVRPLAQSSETPRGGGRSRPAAPRLGPRVLPTYVRISQKVLAARKAVFHVASYAPTDDGHGPIAHAAGPRRRGQSPFVIAICFRDVTGRRSRAAHRRSRRSSDASGRLAFERDCLPAAAVTADGWPRCCTATGGAVDHRAEENAAPKDEPLKVPR